MHIDPATNELVLRIAYCGPGFAGKSTNFGMLRRAWATQADDVVASDVHSERTLTLALRPAGMQLHGRSVRIDLWTVPGQSYYAATRRQMLTGADAAVFVADSRRETLDENIQAMNEMFDNLRQLGLPEDLPIALQYNKQDLPGALRPEQLDPLMNPRGWPRFPATATVGQGVSEALNEIIRRTVELAAELPVPEEPAHGGALASAAAGAWLISCWRCQNMLEVPDARAGTAYTCGVCASVMEVVDAEHGTTRAQPGRQGTGQYTRTKSGTHRPGTGSHAKPPSGSWNRNRSPLPLSAGDTDEYGMKTMPGQQSFAAAVGALDVRSPLGTPTLGTDGFNVPGFEPQTVLDTSPIGRRMRVKETATGRTLRALVMLPNYLREIGGGQALDAHVRLAGPINHLNVLPLLQMTPGADSVVFLSVDPHGYEPLSHVLSRRRALAPPHAMGILRQVALALEEAARAGVVHGWLRPDVILVSPDGQVLVDELAVPSATAYLLRELSGESASTEYFLAPEHTHPDARSDIRTDMFLLGALLYRMLTGEGLVTGYNPAEALHRIAANGAKPLRTATNTFSRDLEQFYRKLTATERKDRFESWRACIEQLDRFGGGAKRQTLRLTQNVSAPPAGSSAAAPRRPGQPGSSYRTPAGGIGMQAARTTAQHRARIASDEALPRQPAKAASGGSGGVITVVVVVLLVAAAAGVALIAMRSSPPPVRTAAPAPPPPRPAQTVVSAPAVPAQSVRPAQPTPSPVAAASPATASPAPAVAPEIASMNRVDRLKEIGGDVVAERFAQALEAVERLDSDVDRLQQRTTVLRAHADRRRFWEGRVRSSADPGTLVTDLAKAVAIWGMEGDRAWMEALLLTRPAAPAAEPVPVAAGPAPVVVAPVAQPDPSKPGPELPSADDAVAAAAIQVLRALAAEQPAQALSALSQVPADSAEQTALAHLIAAWRGRAPLIKRTIEARAAKLRSVHPTTKEACDVVDADEAGVTLATPSGARFQMAWAQLGAKEAGRLSNEALALKDATSAEVATAVAALLVGGEPALAGIQVRRPRVPLGAQQADVEAWYALFRRAEAHVVLQRGIEAAKAANDKALAEAIAELKSKDRAGTPAAAAVPQLEEALKALAAGRAARPGARDRTAFDDVLDLESWPQSTPGWAVAGGVVRHAGATARLGRSDAQSARSVQVTFVAESAAGGLTIQFRGLTLAMDLAAAEFTLGSQGGKKTRAERFPLVTKVPNTVFIRYDDNENRMQVQFNNAAQSTEVLMGEMDGNLGITLSDAAPVAIDDIALTRDEAASPDRAGIKALGYDVIGLPRLADRAIALAEGAGIVLPMIAGQQGVECTVAGSGLLRITAFGQKGAGQAGCDLELDATDERLRITWTGGALVVVDGKGAEIHRGKLPEGADRISLVAPVRATIKLPIAPIR